MESLNQMLWKNKKKTSYYKYKCLRCGKSVMKRGLCSDCMLKP